MYLVNSIYNMMKEIRLKEYGVLLYRLLLAYLFYFIARVLFYLFYSEIIPIDGIGEFFKLTYYGFAFDTTAILYVNALFIVLSVFPLFINTRRSYQKFLFYVYFLFNGIGYSLNFIDMGYYSFSRMRLTMAVKSVVENEQNYLELLGRFAIDYWYLPLLFIGLLFLWIKAYQLISIKPKIIQNVFGYLLFSFLGFAIIGVLTIGGIRGGDFRTSTRPINMLDASKHVRTPNQADLVLNSTFSFLRTLGKTDEFKIPNWVSDKVIEARIKPIKKYERKVAKKPNIVIFIIESLGREYWGCMNQNTDIPNFQSHTPFLDSLATKGYVFDNAFANGRQSIHGMSSILAGIPSFKVAFTSSPYAKQSITSIVSIANEMGYDTSFYHGAANGSMGFLGFGNILGFNHYYGRTEYNNDEDFDGVWGIWDEPFLQFMEKTIDKTPQPFLATIFTVSSHHPFQIPEKYKDKFKEGKIPMHKCVEYTDFSIQKFFEQAKKEDWFYNTIFAFTADHPNQIYYDKYKKAMNRFAVPILFYSPNPDLVGIGKSNAIAQQIDIYPTLVDLMGYNKPFRSWGRSLLSDKNEIPRAINSTGLGVYQMIQGDYIYVFDGEKITGIYSIDDKELSNNLVDSSLPKEVEQGKEDIKAFIQDYMDRIISKKM